VFVKRFTPHIRRPLSMLNIQKNVRHVTADCMLQHLECHYFDTPNEKEVMTLF